MSAYVTGWVLKHSPVTGAARLVLIVLGDRADHEGCNAYPSVASIASEARCTQSTVHRVLRELERDGHVLREGVSHLRTTNYRVLMPAAPSEDRTPPRIGPSDLDAGPSDPDRGDPPRIGPKPSLNPSTEPSGENAGAVERVWAHYQQTIPNGSRYKLDPVRRQLIGKALKVRDVDECCRAISGLAASEYHLEHGYLDIRYALRGGGTSPSVEGTIDRLAAAPNGSGAGRGGMSELDRRRVASLESLMGGAA